MPMPSEENLSVGTSIISVDLDSEPGAAVEGVKELTTELPLPTTRVQVTVRGGTLGRAEALVGKHNWAAAHYWTEPGADLAEDAEDAGSRTVTFEWSELLPAGPVRLRVPYRRGGVA
jgi:hypothetical protein